MECPKQNRFIYRVAQIVSWFVATFLFKRNIIRNEIKGKKGPYVVLANHQAAYDFVNLIGLTRTPLTFVISHSFYHSLPIKGILNKMGVIPKQQFQTTVRDMKQMRAVIDAGKPLAIYPAGLMCEDGLSTPIPKATYKFLKWIDADIYVARVYGTYFAMPKWSNGIRSGETQMDVYRLFSKEEVAAMDLDTLRKKTDEALLFDAYREQEERRIAYRHNDNLEGLEHVLYMCPHCKTEFSVTVKDTSSLVCTACGFEQQSDAYGFLHHRGTVGEEIRYVSDWSRLIYREQKRRMESGEETTLSAKTKIYMLADGKGGFTEAGEGTVTLQRDRFVITGVIRGEEIELSLPSTHFASLPFTPGKYFEIQQGETIYRCVLHDGRLAMKFINMVKIFYELNTTASASK